MGLTRGWETEAAKRLVFMLRQEIVVRKLDDLGLLLDRPSSPDVLTAERRTFAGVTVREWAECPKGHALVYAGDRLAAIIKLKEE